MFVGICKLELHLMEGNSLKEKRQVIRSIIERLKNRFNISIAEVGDLDVIRRSSIGFTVVSNEKTYIERLMGKVINFIDSDVRVQIIDIDKEIH
ncbi:MAG TPA: DUF503 domain-containing protein [Firmicutes bacterium]|jgi:uncharacterized protein YlxP (DUF503 family)|nr:DUF503 domain-containing protein [Bacillota bacterium]